MPTATVSEPSLVSALFRHLDALRTRYLVLRNHAGYPHRLLKPDIGLLIDPKHAGLLVEAVEATCHELGWEWSLRRSARNNVVLDLQAPEGSRIKIDARTYESIPLRPAHRLVPGLSYKVFWEQVRTRRVRRGGCQFNAYGHPDELILLLNQWRRKRERRYQEEIAAALRDPETAAWFERATGFTAAAVEAAPAFQAWHEEALRHLVEARWGAERPGRVVRTHLRALRLLLARGRPSRAPLIYLAGPDGAGKTALTEALSEFLRQRGIRHRRLYSLRLLLRGAVRRGLRLYRAARRLPAAGFEAHWQRLEQGLLPRDIPGWEALKAARLVADVADTVVGGLVAQLLRLRGELVVVETSPYDVFIKYGMPELPALERLLAPALPAPTQLLLLSADPATISARKPELSAVEVADYYARLDRVVDHARIGGRTLEVDTGERVEVSIRPVREQVVRAVAAARRRTLPRCLPRALATTPCPPALRQALYASEDAVEVLKGEPGRTVIRVHRTKAPPVIVKWWARDDLRGRLRTRSGTASWDHEWRNLCALHAAGVRVPRPLGLLRVQEASVPVHAVLLEDLGRCVVALDHLKELVAAGDEAARARFDAELIELTAQVLGAGYDDSDHRLNNIVVGPDGRPVRLDVELARRSRPGPLGWRGRGVTLGRLLATYVYAVQPRVELAQRFTEVLARRLAPPWPVRRVADGVVQGMLAQQRAGRGIDTRVALPW